MARNFNQPWFDRKYSGGQKPSLEDRAELFKEILRSSDRCRRDLSEAMGDALFRLNQKGGYSPSLHMIAYELVYTIGPAVSLDADVLKKYMNLYQSAIKKHENLNVFSSNFHDTN